VGSRRLPERSPEAEQLGQMVRDALARNPMFMTAVLPKQVFPPLFNRYDAEGDELRIACRQCGRAMQHRDVRALKESRTLPRRVRHATFPAARFAAPRVSYSLSGELRGWRGKISQGPCDTSERPDRAAKVVALDCDHRLQTSS